MAPTNHGLIKAGDWISGTSQLDERFIGYVDSLHDGGILKVWVTQSDRDEIVGTPIEAKLAKVKKLPDSAPSSPEEVRSLIELALMTHDEGWFTELSAGLMAPSPTANDRYANLREHDFPRSRLFGINPRDTMDV